MSFAMCSTGWSRDVHIGKSPQMRVIGTAVSVPIRDSVAYATSRILATCRPAAGIISQRNSEPGNENVRMTSSPPVS